jgi:hypothetical protein
LLFAVLDALGVRRNDATHRLSVHAQCGGAATFMRAIVAQPTRFANSHHFMNNCVTGTWEPVRSLLVSHHHIVRRSDFWISCVRA